MGRLDGKVAIVTGGGAGMGKTAAILFAKEGAKVVLVGRSSQNIDETAGMIREAGGAATPVKTDVSKTEDVKLMVKTAIDSYGKLDILFNNAGIAPDVVALTTECTEEDFTNLMDVNLKGVWLGMKYAIPEMIKGGGGSIVNTSSLAADVGQRGTSLYAGTKGAILSMSRVVAVEFAKQNIRVNCIKPGLVYTPMVKTVIKDNPEFFEMWKAASPMGSLIPPEEIAQLALFLASDEARHITGQELTVDGGSEIDSHFHLV